MSDLHYLCDITRKSGQLYHKCALHGMIHLVISNHPGTISSSQSPHLINICCFRKRIIDSLEIYGIVYSLRVPYVNKKLLFLRTSIITFSHSVQESVVKLDFRPSHLYGNRNIENIIEIKIYEDDDQLNTMISRLQEPYLYFLY